MKKLCSGCWNEWRINGEWTLRVVKGKRRGMNPPALDRINKFVARHFSVSIIEWNRRNFHYFHSLSISEREKTTKFGNFFGLCREKSCVGGLSFCSKKCGVFIFRFCFSAFNLNGNHNGKIKLCFSQVIKQKKN